MLDLPLCVLHPVRTAIRLLVFSLLICFDVLQSIWTSLLGRAPATKGRTSSGQHPKALTCAGIVFTDSKSSVAQLQEVTNGILAALISAKASAVTIHEAFPRLEQVLVPHEVQAAAHAWSARLRVLHSSPDTTARSWQALWNCDPCPDDSLTVHPDAACQCAVHAALATTGCTRTHSLERELAAMPGADADRSTNPVTDPAQAAAVTPASSYRACGPCDACAQARSAAAATPDGDYLQRRLTRTLPAGTFADLDLILVVGPVMCLAGLPPWQARFGEIQHLGELRGRAEAERAVREALARYHRTLQRHGK